MAADSWLGMTVVAAFVGATSSRVGIFVKDYWFARKFEDWKQKQALNQLHRKFRDPLAGSAVDLKGRLSEIVTERPCIYLRDEVLSLHPTKQLKNDIDDEYFQRYKLVSTIYRLCAFLGWLELYRQELTFLQAGDGQRSEQLDRAIAAIKGDLADGQINEAPDWPVWRDTLIFREELRGIGESLIETRGTTRTVMGYGRFVELFEAESPSMTKHWADVVTNFFIGVGHGEKDFRQTRLERLTKHLDVLVELLVEAK